MRARGNKPQTKRAATKTRTKKKENGGSGGWQRKRRAAGNKQPPKQEAPKTRMEKRTRGVGGRRRKPVPRSRTPGAGNQRKQETTGAHTHEQKKEGKQTNKNGQPQPGGGPPKQKDKTAEGEPRRTKMGPGGQPARRGQEKPVHAHTHGTPAWRLPTRKGRCRRPHETAPVHRPPPPSNDGRYGKPDTSVTGSTHANHRSARSPRTRPDGPATDNPIAGPRTGTMRSEPSAPSSTCPAQPPSKSAGDSPRGGERHQGNRTADRSTESDRTGRGAAHHAGPRGTPERHAAGHNQGTRTGAKQQRPPDAADPEKAHNTQRTTAQEQVPGNPSCRSDRGVRAPAANPAPASYGINAVRMDECARGSVPSPCRLRNSRRPNERVRARRVPSPCRLRQAAVRMDECTSRSDAPHTQQGTHSAHR